MIKTLTNGLCLLRSSIWYDYSVYPIQKRTIAWKKIFIWASTGLFVCLVVGIIGFFGLAIYVSRDLPNPNKVVRREGFSTKIFDRNGKLLYDVFADQRRTPVTFEQIPLTLRQATVAIEDKNFYKNPGIDPLTPLRIGWNVITKHRVIGGSGLTQQLVKNTLLTSERTVVRKLKEFILALQVEGKYSKDEILQMYLNEAPYGGSAYGVGSAAEIYFGKPVSQLTLVESAILAGLPQWPPYYSPHAGKNYIPRTKDVLRRMREDGYITADQEKEADEQLETWPIQETTGLLKAPHFVFYVKQQLIDRYGEQVVEQGGLRVTTTLDLDLQEAAEKIVAEEIEKVKHLKITNGAAAVLDTTNGQILSMVGSRGWSDPNYDGKFNVVTANRQPGSTIKPVVYLTGLQKGYTAASMLMDVKTAFPGGDKPEYVPENYDGKFRGPISVRDSLGNSINIPAVKMVALVGIPNMLQQAYDLGFTTLKPTPELLKRLGLSVALGGGEVRLIDMVGAYSSFANGGKKVEPTAILTVQDKDGNVLEQWRDETHIQVISPEAAFIMSSILSDPSARTITFGAATSLTLPGRTIAVKTGTTNDKRDNWTVGWEANGPITGVWVGNNDNSPMTQVASGITGASPIWKRIMQTAENGRSANQFATPSGIISLDVDKLSGYPAHDGFVSRKEFFIKGTEPTGQDPIHKMVKVCKGEGKLATVPDIQSGNYDQREGFYFSEQDPFEAGNWTNKWQEGILNWLKDQQDPKYHPPTELCGSSNPVWITVLEPKDKVRINESSVKIRLDIATPNTISWTEISLDGTLIQRLTAAPWEYTLTNLTDGVHQLDIKAHDDKGFEGTRLLKFSINQDWKE